MPLCRCWGRCASFATLAKAAGGGRPSAPRRDVPVARRGRVCGATIFLRRPCSIKRSARPLAPLNCFFNVLLHP